MTDPEIGYQAETLWDFASVLAQNTVDDAAVNTVLNLHTMSDEGRCAHCANLASYAIMWPCDTVRVIATHYGIGAPK